MYCFVDTETTGLNPYRHEIIQFAYIQVNEKYNFENYGSYKVFPEHLETASIRALEINGYTKEKWNSTYTLLQHELREKIVEFTSNRIIAGHNVNFDVGFMKEVINRQHGHYYPDNTLYPWTGHHFVDTCAMAWPLKQFGIVKSISLKALCDHFDIPLNNQHDALNDVVATLELAKKLTELYKNALCG